MKKKYVVAFSFLATVFFILAISIITLVLAQPTAPTADSFGVENTSGGAGTYVEVPVNITNVTNGRVQCIRLRVDYTDSVLNLMNISKGDLTSAWTHLQLGEDRHTMVIATTKTEDAIPIGSTGSVVLLNFSVIGSSGDTSPMNMTLIEVSNSEGVVGTAPARNGTFTVTGETTPTPTPTPSTGGGSGGGGAFLPLPSPTLTPYLTATPVPAETSTLTPTVTPPTATPAQTPVPAIPAAQVPVISWSIIMIAIIISVIIVLTGYLLIRKML
jgi:hypothetical protein